jgi:hypothetical protein
MAYAFGFPKDVTDLITDMSDWRLEQVVREGGTPSARCLNIASEYLLAQGRHVDENKEYLTFSENGAALWRFALESFEWEVIREWPR